jgi:uncharacterized protein (DUF433 family)
MAVPRSVRFDDDVLDRLGRYVQAHPGTSTSSVANLFVDEALRSYEHSVIVFRPGPTGRRAALAAGPDVWEVIGALKALREETPSLADDDLRDALAEVTGLSADQVNAALRYYVAYPDEIDERIAANEAAAAREHALWESQQALLGHTA